MHEECHAGYDDKSFYTKLLYSFVWTCSDHIRSYDIIPGMCVCLP